jgi:hypothetical protein
LVERDTMTEQEQAVIDAARSWVQRSPALTIADTELVAAVYALDGVPPPTLLGLPVQLDPAVPEDVLEIHSASGDRYRIPLTAERRELDDYATEYREQLAAITVREEYADLARLFDRFKAGTISSVEMRGMGPRGFLDWLLGEQARRDTEQRVSRETP